MFESLLKNCSSACKEYEEAVWYMSFIQTMFASHVSKWFSYYYFSKNKRPKLLFPILQLKRLNCKNDVIIHI